MDKKLAEEIFKKCPILFRQRNAGVDKNLMIFGFECADGWFDIINELSVAAEAIALTLKERGLEEHYLPSVVQVKEKFGTLRYYIDNATDEIQDLVDDAEEKSAVTCEVCGSIGKLRKNSYLVVLCDACHVGKQD